jgi:hypothetical protein
MGDRPAVAYRSSTGTLAYKTMVKELILYTPQRHADLQGQIVLTRHVGLVSV